MSIQAFPDFPHGTMNKAVVATLSAALEEERKGLIACLLTRAYFNTVRRSEYRGICDISHEQCNLLATEQQSANVLKQEAL